MVGLVSAGGLRSMLPRSANGHSTLPPHFPFQSAVRHTQTHTHTLFIYKCVKEKLPQKYLQFAIVVCVHRNDSLSCPRSPFSSSSSSSLGPFYFSRLFLPYHSFVFLSFTPAPAISHSPPGLPLCLFDGQLPPPTTGTPSGGQALLILR